jgi:hypothetical protein
MGVGFISEATMAPAIDRAGRAFVSAATGRSRSAIPQNRTRPQVAYPRGERSGFAGPVPSRGARDPLRVPH